MNRRLLIFLLLAVALSQLLLWWLEPEPQPVATTGPPRSGYSLRNFHLEVLRRDGSIGFSMHAPHLQRRNSDGSLFIDEPRFRLPTDQGPGWHGRAERGWVRADGGLLKLSGEVRLKRPPATRILTSNLTAWPDQRRLATKAPVEIHQPGRILSGTGLKANLDTHTLELLADVHGTFQPETGH